jgi:peptidoglycan/xylan/chitin deacetylase (PgdA/CDA1 family)
MTLKQQLFRAASMVGATEAVAASRWRQRRLMVLCYHGISISDEHECDPNLFMAQETFRARLAFLHSHGYNVLALDDALSRLNEGRLPPRSVALTFDDGLQNFSTRAVPLLEEYNFPATLYLTTYYCDTRLPVFDTALSYVLWRGRTHSGSISALIGHTTPLGVQTDVDRAATVLAIRQHASECGFSAAEKDTLLEALALQMGVNMGMIREDLMMHIMAPEVVRALPPLIDVQLHTHRHRTPQDERQFRREIADNRNRIRELFPQGRDLTHFCYPSGVYAGEFLAWLRAEGVRYATTCIPDIVDASSDPLLLPRFVDTEHQPIETFAAWVSGLSALLPQRQEHRLDQTLLTTE